VAVFTPKEFRCLSMRCTLGYLQLERKALWAQHTVTVRKWVDQNVQVCLSKVSGISDVKCKCEFSCVLLCLWSVTWLFWI
jgi:hypothetical protein